MTDESRAIARIEAEVKNLSERWERIEPMLLERSGTLSQDMTTSKVLEVSITLSTNSTNLEWKAYARTLELNNP